jgi:Protein of unknown function (DUF1838)
MIVRHMIGAALLAASATSSAKNLDVTNGDDAVAMFRKIQCSRIDGEVRFYHWSGKVYSRVPGEPDRLLYRVEGMNARACKTVTDDKRGTGVRQVSREIMLYLDPKSGEVLRSWQNPWTGKTHDVIHVANDPVNMRAPMFAKNADGTPNLIDMRLDGGKFFWNIEVPLFYPNPLGGDYQAAAGNQYHATEMFNFIMDEKDLLDGKKPSADSSIVSWVRIAPWLPFMEMGSRPGVMYVNATGKKMQSFEQLPSVLKDEIRKTYSIYMTAPPLDDARYNETSWTYYKKLMDAKKAEKK